MMRPLYLGSQRAAVGVSSPWNIDGIPNHRCRLATAGVKNTLLNRRRLTRYRCGRHNLFNGRQSAELLGSDASRLVTKSDNVPCAAHWASMRTRRGDGAARALRIFAEHGLSIQTLQPP